MSQLKALFDLPLSNVSSMLIPDGMLCEQLLPTVEAAQQSGKLAKYGTNHLRIEASLKGGRSEFRRVESITRSTASFQIEGHGLEDIVTKEDYKNVQEPYDAEKDAVIGLTNLLWLVKEKGLADSLTSTSIMTQNTTLSGTGQFSDYINSDPIAKFATARSTVRSGSGVPPNVAAMDYAVWNVLRFHPQMLDALGFKQNRPGGLSQDEMAVALGVKKVLIAEAVYESAAEGQTSSLSPVWGKHIVFAVAPEKAMPYQVSLGYMVRYAGEPPRKVTKYAINNPSGATGILCEDDFDQLISNAGAGYLIYNAIA